MNKLFPVKKLVYGIVILSFVPNASSAATCTNYETQYVAMYVGYFDGPSNNMNYWKTELPKKIKLVSDNYVSANLPLIQSCNNNGTQCFNQTVKDKIHKEWNGAYYGLLSDVVGSMSTMLEQYAKYEWSRTGVTSMTGVNQVCVDNLYYFGSRNATIKEIFDSISTEAKKLIDPLKSMVESGTITKYQGLETAKFIRDNVKKIQLKMSDSGALKNPTIMTNINANISKIYNELDNSVAAINALPGDANPPAGFTGIKDNSDTIRSSLVAVHNELKRIKDQITQYISPPMQTTPENLENIRLNVFWLGTPLTNITITLNQIDKITPQATKDEFNTTAQTIRDDYTATIVSVSDAINAEAQKVYNTLIETGVESLYLKAQTSISQLKPTSTSDEFNAAVTLVSKFKEDYNANLAKFLQFQEFHATIFAYSADFSKKDTNSNLVKNNTSLLNQKNELNTKKIDLMSKFETLNKDIDVLKSQTKLAAVMTDRAAFKTQTETQRSLLLSELQALLNKLNDNSTSNLALIIQANQKVKDIIAINASIKVILDKIRLSTNGVTSGDLKATQMEIDEDQIGKGADLAVKTAKSSLKTMIGKFCSAASTGIANCITTNNNQNNCASWRNLAPEITNVVYSKEACEYFLSTKNNLEVMNEYVKPASLTSSSVVNSTAGKPVSPNKNTKKK